MLEIGNVIELSDGHEYVVTNKVSHGNRFYFFIIGKNDLKKFKYVLLDNDELVEIEDLSIIRDLSLVMQKEMS